MILWQGVINKGRILKLFPSDVVLKVRTIMLDQNGFFYRTRKFRPKERFTETESCRRQSYMHPFLLLMGRRKANQNREIFIFLTFFNQRKVRFCSRNSFFWFAFSLLGTKVPAESVFGPSIEVIQTRRGIFERTLPCKSKYVLNIGRIFV